MDAGNLPADRPSPFGRYHLVVLGGGPAGTVAAREAARRGVRAALVLDERAAGPVPAQNGAGIDRPPPSQADRNAAARSELADQVRRARLLAGLTEPVDLPAEAGVDVCRGRVKFSRPHAVRVGGRELRFRKAVIATGATTAPVDIDGADRCECLTPETLDEQTDLPRRLAVVGCDAGACFWAQTFCRFGSEVHLIGRERKILTEEDPDAAAVLRAQLAQDGVRMHLGCDELAIAVTGNLRSVLIGRGGRREKLLADQILLCGPRQPNTAGLALERAGVAYTDRGVVVGDRLQTTARHIFAAGAVCGSQFDSPQAAEATARLAVHNALSFVPRRLSRLVIPRCIYTDPALARVGLSPGEAAARRIEIDTYRVTLEEADEAIPGPRRRGFIAVHVRRRTGRVVGATVVAEAAEELIAPLVLLMSGNWPLSALADAIPCRPSRTELLTRLAEQCAETRAAPLWRRMLLRYNLTRRRQTSR